MLISHFLARVAASGSAHMWIEFTWKYMAVLTFTAVLLHQSVNFCIS